jgi:hypothetical protein
MENRVQKIVDTLTKGTEEDKLSWESTARETEFRMELNKGSITVDSWVNFDHENGEEEKLADISFLNKDGELIDRVIFSQETDRLDYRAVVNLQGMARRKSLNIDEKINDIMSELQKKIGE